MTNPTQVHFITLCVVDHDNIGLAAMEELIEDSVYRSGRTIVTAIDSNSTSVDWSDKHPLNITKNAVYEGRKLFQSL